MRRLIPLVTDAPLYLVVSITAAPLLVILFSWWTPVDDIFIHLFKTGLSEVMINTMWLLLGVGIGTTVLGVSLAWFTTTFDFPGRSFFDWALVLPLAIPTYVLAFVSLSLFDRTGPIQQFLWEQGSGVILPPIRSTGGIIWVMTLALYPYVYLFARNGFQTQGVRANEVARSLGKHPMVTLFKITLPMSRPMIISGLMLVLMETLSDFGAVSIFNYDTFTTTIYKAWFSLFSLNAAAKFSSFLVLLVFCLVFLEEAARRRRRYTPADKPPAPVVRTALTGIPRIGVAIYCIIILLFAFIIPVVELFNKASMGFDSFRGGRSAFDLRYLGLLNRSILLATMAALLTTGLGLLLVYSERISAQLAADAPLKTSLLVRFATLGYALPGTILAVGGIMLVTFIDHRLTNGLGITGSLMTGTISAMMLGYLSRFIVLSYNSINVAMVRITPHISEAARSLGATPLRIMRKIQIPLVRGGIFSGALLVFVDVMKEMPITLMTRPFGWDTLAVQIFQFTSEGSWEQAALPSLTLVFLGLIPVILLTRPTRFRH
ncbi:MAG: iron ABC transporter permease [Nitrospirota bacterium]